MSDNKSTYVKIARMLTDIVETELHFTESLSLGEDRPLVQSIMFDLVHFIAAHRRKIQYGKKN